MAIPDASVVAQTIVTSLGIPEAGKDAALVAYTAIADAILSAVKAGTITVAGTAANVTAGPATAAVTAIGTIS